MEDALIAQSAGGGCTLLYHDLALFKHLYRRVALVSSFCDMADDNQLETSESSLFALAPLDSEWRPILHVSNQVVLYNPTSHALSIRQHTISSSPRILAKRILNDRCPYCHRLLPHDGPAEDEDAELELVDSELEDHPRSRVPNYFQLLQVANETMSTPPTPTRRSASSGRLSRDPSPSATRSDADGQPFRTESMAEGYFKAFFQEECRLGMGANGSVYLCQVRRYIRDSLVMH